MKKTSLTALFIFLTLILFGQTRKESGDIKAIEKLIHKEIRSFMEKDWEDFEDCWLQKPYTRHFVSSKSAFNGMIGWDKMKDLISKSFEIEGPRGYSITKTDIDIQVFGKAAYATFTENYNSTVDMNPREIVGLNNAFFVKRDGDWKFVCMNIVNTSSFQDANNHRDLIQEFHETVSGKAKTREIFEKYISNQSLIRQNIAVELAFPMYELTADEILVDGIKVVVRAKFKGVQEGQYGDIAPTGNLVSLPVVLIYTLSNGKITDSSITYDNASMLRQLGAI